MSFNFTIPSMNLFEFPMRTVSPTASITSDISSVSCLEDTPVPVLQHLKCSICMGTLKEPVTTTCGHTFCYSCLRHHLNNNHNCPLCKSSVNERLKTNITLNEILTAYHEAQRPHPPQPSPNDFTGQPGEVPCDICTDNPKKAVKSCLMCSQSYCADHLKGHQKPWLKGHTLKEPCSDLDRRICMDHGRILEFYSVSEEKLLCSSCVQDGMEVVVVEKARDRKQSELNSNINKTKEKLQRRELKKKEFHESATSCLGLIDREKEELKKVFNAITEAVKKAEEEVLRPLEDRRREVEREVKDLKGKLQEEITKFNKTISDLQEISAEEEPIFFLQRYPSNTTLDEGSDWSGVDVDTSLMFGTLQRTQRTILDEVNNEFKNLLIIEIERIKKFAVDVTLDPDTANPQLQISDDLREVQSVREDLPKTMGGDDGGSFDRFDVFGSVLGQNRLTQGGAFWEVEVGNKRGWDVGVALEDANRKGDLSLKPSQGYWVIVHYDDEHYAALEDSPILLCLQNKPSKVGVFVDFQEKLVSFYDLGAKTHIHSFTDCDFGGGVRPYFSPHLNHDAPLVIHHC
ncbi:E3 ubiquitin-protein ligase TRIM11-like [Trichomycterus rosablanca]|uniref:E3 ubiquitin-protein ligase TRIM11-like n=1 Tax=Trichomycterus rosablanca TaxID=2290929 RepID=UPI002F357AE5